MIALRADVSTMKNIIRFFRRFQKTGGTDLPAFAEQFLRQRYTQPGFERERSELMYSISLMALPFYAEELNADHSTSLLAILGALSEAERFVIDPGIVMRKAAGWKNRDLWGQIVGGAGIADLRAALSEAERRFQEYMASMSRLEMGLR